MQGHLTHSWYLGKFFFDSVLKGNEGDGIVIGASNVKHLEENLEALRKGPLPEKVVEAITKITQFMKIRI